MLQQRIKTDPQSGIALNKKKICCFSWLWKFKEIVWVTVIEKNVDALLDDTCSSWMRIITINCHTLKFSGSLGKNRVCASLCGLFKVRLYNTRVLAGLSYNLTDVIKFVRCISINSLRLACFQKQRQCNCTILFHSNPVPVVVSCCQSVVSS